MDRYARIPRPQSRYRQRLDALAFSGGARRRGSGPHGASPERGALLERRRVHPGEDAPRPRVRDPAAPLRL